jgi:hypothetical protein
MAILTSKISSPFLVSSRKAARIKQDKGSSISDICNLFSMQQVNRDYYIKSRIAFMHMNTEKDLDGSAIKVGGDLVGLYNYLSAHNIR